LTVCIIQLAYVGSKPFSAQGLYYGPVSPQLLPSKDIYENDSMLIRTIVFWVVATVGTATAATLSDQVTSPLTSREESLEKPNRLDQWTVFQWGGRLLLQAGDPVALDGRADPVRIGVLELGGDLTLGHRITLHGLVLYEQQITDPPQIDELFISAVIAQSLQLQLGRQYVPFGNYDTAMINKPLTQQHACDALERLDAAYRPPLEEGSLPGARWFPSP
jgi:hypothetical protein